MSLAGNDSEVPVHFRDFALWAELERGDTRQERGNGSEAAKLLRLRSQLGEFP
jgi:hypothetical protein